MVWNLPAAASHTRNLMLPLAQRLNLATMRAAVATAAFIVLAAVLILSLPLFAKGAPLASTAGVVLAHNPFAGSSSTETDVAQLANGHPASASRLSQLPTQ